MFFFGGYELKEVALINDLLKSMSNAIAFDIGANLGGHALPMATNAVEVHAFEPFGPLADKIEERANSLIASKIKVHRFGLGDCAENKPYYLDKNSNNSGTGSFIAEHANAPQIETLSIRLGDEWANGLRVDFIKIDVEGYEAPALSGLKETLVKNEPIIMMEVTESSWKMFSNYGGIDAVIPFEFDSYEIQNPSYLFGILQIDRYKLAPILSIIPRKASFNVLLVPKHRRANLSQIFDNI